MQERRRVPRGRTYLGGRIAFNRRCSTLNCLVRDMSQNGAKLVFEGVVAIPAEFDLMIRGASDSRRASVVWRSERAAGVCFPHSVRDGVVAIESAGRINRLEAERQMLERRIAQLSEPA